MKLKKWLLPALLLAAVVSVGWWLFANKEQPAKTQPNNNQAQSSPQQKPTDTPEQPLVTFDKSKYSTDDPTSIWVVVNKKRPLQPKDYAPTDLTQVGNGQQLRAQAAAALEKLRQSASNSGMTIYPYSGYRSYATQVSVYNREVSNYGQAIADTQSARPGYSEHQTGLSIDVGTAGCVIDDCFANTTEGQWTAEHAYEYGFIIRYPATKQNITGYRYEPWHIRYVGVELATEMKNQGVQTMEEFFGLPPAPSY